MTQTPMGTAYIEIAPLMGDFTKKIADTFTGIKPQEVKVDANTKNFATTITDAAKKIKVPDVVLGVDGKGFKTNADKVIRGYTPPEVRADVKFDVYKPDFDYSSEARDAGKQAGRSFSQGMDEGTSGMPGIGERAETTFDGMATRASIAAGGIGDLAGALGDYGYISEAAVEKATLASSAIMGIAGISDLAVLSVQGLRAAKAALTLENIRNTASSIASRAATLGSTIVQGAATAATYAQAAAQRVLNAAMKANPIGIIITVLGLLVGAIVYAYQNSETFRNVVQAAWRGIQAAASYAWNNVIKPVFNAIVGFVNKWLIPAFKLYAQIVSVVFNAVKDKIRNVWHNNIKPVVDAIRNFFVNTLPNAFRSFRDANSQIFDAVKNKISTVWYDKIKPVLDKIKAFPGTISTAFKNMRDKVGEYLDGIRSKAATPVNFVINEVYNNGLRKALNLIPGVNLAEATPIKMATGGVLPGYSPGRDIHQFVSPTGGRLALSGGEAIMRPEFTRMVGGEAGVARLNRMARKAQHFASGGIFDVVPGNRVTNRHSKAQYPWAAFAGDFAMPQGTRVSNWRDGVVSAANRWNHSYGNHVRVDHGNGIGSLYAHLSRIAVRVGQQIAGGAEIGRVGSTGNSTGPHLHLETLRRSYLGGADAPSGGNIFSDVWDWAKSKVKGAIDLVGGKINGMGDSFGPWGSLVGKAAKHALSNALSWGKNKEKNASGSYDTPTGDAIMRWAPTVRAALARTGLPGSLEDNWLRQIRSESGGNPRAVQGAIGDVNNRSGDLAHGLVQVIGSTFAAFRDKSLPNDRFHPLANLVAGMNWAKFKNYNQETFIGAGHGYALGTEYAKSGWHWVGEEGPELMKFRGGEKVKSNRDSMGMTSTKGMRIEGTMDLGNGIEGYIRGIVVDEIDGNDNFNSTMGRMR